jgi:hypothetical protein
MSRREGMAQLMDEDGNEYDTNPSDYQIDAGKREAKERSYQQE